MRTVGQIAGIPKQTDLAKYPDSSVINETPTSDGTPVVEEIYGDVLVNLYKLLRITKTNATGQADNETNGYQLVQALQKLSNTLNDAEQVMNLVGTVWSVNQDLSILPDKFIMLVRPSDDYQAATAYTLKGANDNPVYPFTAANGFSAGDEVLLIIDQAGVRAYNLSPAPAVQETFTPFGSPLAFNDSAKVWYQSEGILFSDVPEQYDVQAAIRAASGDGTLQLYELFLINDYLICLVFSDASTTYKIYQVPIGNINAPVLMAISGHTFPIGTDNRPFVYTDGQQIYISNGTGNNADNFNIDKFNFDLDTHTVTYVSTISLDAAFEKTTNAVVNNAKLITYVNGTLRSYNLATGAVTLLGSYPALLGVLFKLGGQIYYSNGEVAKKWSV